MTINVNIDELIKLGPYTCSKLLNKSHPIDLMNSARTEGDVEWVEVMLLMGYSVYFPYLDLLSEEAGLKMLKVMYGEGNMNSHYEYLYRLKFKTAYQSQIDYVNSLTDKKWNFKNVYKMKFTEKVSGTSWDRHFHDRKVVERDVHQFVIQQNITPTGCVTFTLLDEQGSFRGLLRTQKVREDNTYLNYDEDTEQVAIDSPMSEEMLKRFNEEYNLAAHEMCTNLFKNVSRGVNIIKYVPELEITITKNYACASIPKCAEHVYSSPVDEKFMENLDLTDTSIISLE